MVIGYLVFYYQDHRCTASIAISGVDISGAAYVVLCTDALPAAKVSLAKPWLKVNQTFGEEDSKTRYSVQAWNWPAAERSQHDKMGFYEGGGFTSGSPGFAWSDFAGKD